jgi:hypothetical protein
VREHAVRERAVRERAVRERAVRERIERAGAAGEDRSVVLVSLGPAAPGEALIAGVRQLRAAGAGVHLVSRVPPAGPLGEVVSGHTAVGRARGGPVPLGKLAFDPHRLPGAVRVVFGRRTRDLVRGADTLVAVDAAARPAIWLAGRLNRRALVVNGLPAALARLG